MPVIVIRLHPDKPTDGNTFNGYLKGLRIVIADRSFADPDGRLPIHVLGSAEFDPPDPNATIVQHETTALPPAMRPVATAAIEVTLPADEYLSVDLVLTVTRTIAGDTTPLVVKDLNYNVGFAVNAKTKLPVPLPITKSPDLYAALSPVALYLALPPSTEGLPAGTAFLEVPVDGSPPPFKAVLKAMQDVVAKDPGPGSLPDLAALSPSQCRHIAREIVFNRFLEPLPEPSKPLEELYGIGSDDNARRQFEADLITYYAVHSTTAEVLAKYVYGVSAALACQATSMAATQVELTVPVFPGLIPVAGGVPTVSVVVTQ